MKKIIVVLIITLTASAISQNANAQLWKKIKREVKTRVEDHVVNDAGNVADKTVDKTEDAAINSVKGSNNNNQDYNNETTAQQTSSNTQPVAPSEPVAQTTTPVISTAASYKNYDFVPGDKIIFETDFKNQQDAELPARLGTLSGTAEIQTYQGEKILHLEKGGAVSLIPMIDSANYLPDQFTVEFDLMYNTPNPQEYNTFEVDFYKRDKTKQDLHFNEGDYRFYLYEADQIDFGPNIKGKSLSDAVQKDLKVPNTWHHIAIYVHNNIGKVYVDQYRIAASNMMPKGVTKLAIKTDGRMEYMIKNLRIAGGGSDAYHKIMTEGKLVTHGIHFASGKADILPESMGTINEVYTILKNHDDLKFEIDGYTDNDGSADLNLKLSQQRADAVKDKLVGMGVSTSRLTTKGFGETKPMDTNDTPEGKANNRRVEFVKK